MKISNCLKLVLLCGCPPDNSNFQLQLDNEERVTDENNQTKIVVNDTTIESCSRSELNGSNSADTINIHDFMEKTCLSNQDHSELPLIYSPELSYQDEQRAIALILEYLKMKYPKKNKIEEPEHFQSDIINSEDEPPVLKLKAEQFKTGLSLLDCHDSAKDRKSKLFKSRGKSLELDLTNKKDNSKKKMLKTYSVKVKNNDADIEIEKECFKSSRFRAPVSFFKRFTSHTALHSRTIVETSDLEIKEVIFSDQNESYKKSSSLSDMNKNSQLMKFKNKLSNSRVTESPSNSGNMNNRVSLLSPSVSVVLNPNILDEIAPYILRFVKYYIGDFRRYLLDAFIGVDSISLDYFESMIKVIDNFPIDDLTLFKNLKYTLALLFPEEENSCTDNSTSETDNQTVGSRYRENLKRKEDFEPHINYKYTIKNRKTINNDSKAMGDLPSFIVRYYPVGNKIYKNQCSQTEGNTSN